MEAEGAREGLARELEGAARKAEEDTALSREQDLESEAAFERMMQEVSSLRSQLAACSMDKLGMGSWGLHEQWGGQGGYETFTNPHGTLRRCPAGGRPKAPGRRRGAHCDEPGRGRRRRRWRDRCLPSLYDDQHRGPSVCTRNEPLRIPLGIPPPRQAFRPSFTPAWR